MKTFIIGYGNDSRNDDGVGWFVIAKLAKLGLPDVTFETAHQLEIEVAETIRDFDRVIFVDAAIPESPEPWATEEVIPGFQSHAVAHFLTPADVLGLCRTLYGPTPTGRLFSIRGHDFNFGMELSPATRQAACEVVEAIEEELAPTCTRCP